MYKIALLGVVMFIVGVCLGPFVSDVTHDSFLQFYGSALLTAVGMMTVFFSFILS